MALHCREAIAVGDVVSDENRCTTGERRLLHEGLDRSCLVMGRRLDLYDRIAFLQFEITATCDVQPLHEFPYLLGKIGNAAIMHSQCELLVLQQQPCMRRDESCQSLAQHRQTRRVGSRR